MSYLIITHEDGRTEVLGDVNQARKAEGLPHLNAQNRLVSEDDLNLIDEMGE